jgi:hypothetical protein
VTIRRKLVVGDLALVESDLDYQGKQHQEVSIFEFRDGKVARLTQYFPEPFEAPESRALRLAWRPWRTTVLAARLVRHTRGRYRTACYPAPGHDPRCGWFRTP